MKEVKFRLSGNKLSLFISLAIISLLMHNCRTGTEAYKSRIPPPPGWELLWSDEFSNNMVDTSKWKVEEFEYKNGNFKKENIRIEENALQFKSSIEDGKRYGGRVMSKDMFAPPVRFEIRFKPIMKPGSFIALWLYPTVRNSEMYASYNKTVYKEFDFLECGGGENIVTDDDIKIKAWATVHSWHAANPFVSGSNVRAAVHIAPFISVGNPVEWQELRFDWDNETSANGNEVRYYWRKSGSEWGEPYYTVRPDSNFFPSDDKMNQYAFGNVKYVEILKNVWNDPMPLNFFSHTRAIEGWLSQESLAKENKNTWGGVEPDTADYPFDMPIDYVRVYVPANDKRLSK